MVPRVSGVGVGGRFSGGESLRSHSAQVRVSDLLAQRVWRGTRTGTSRMPSIRRIPYFCASTMCATGLAACTVANVRLHMGSSS